MRHFLPYWETPVPAETFAVRFCQFSPAGPRGQAKSPHPTGIPACDELLYFVRLGGLPQGIEAGKDGVEEGQPQGGNVVEEEPAVA